CPVPIPKSEERTRRLYSAHSDVRNVRLAGQHGHRRIFPAVGRNLARAPRLGPSPLVAPVLASLALAALPAGVDCRLGDPGAGAAGFALLSLSLGDALGHFGLPNGDTLRGLEAGPAAALGALAGVALAGWATGQFDLPEIGLTR